MIRTILLSIMLVGCVPIQFDCVDYCPSQEAVDAVIEEYAAHGITLTLIDYPNVVDRMVTIRVTRSNSRVAFGYAYEERSHIDIAIPYSTPEWERSMSECMLMHELGHMFSLDHTKGPSVMRKVCDLEYLTYSPAEWLEVVAHIRNNYDT